MSRLTISTAIAWALTMLLLWFMIRLDSATPSPVRIGVSEPSPARSALRSPRADAQPIAPSCEDSENSLRALLGSARQCTSDDDCTLFDFGYPIDCMTSVAKSRITDLRLEYKAYEQSCKYRVYFDCPAEPMERRAVCRENRCTVSLESNDALKEQTLDYLGIE